MARQRACHALAHARFAPTFVASAPLADLYTLATKMARVVMNAAARRVRTALAHPPALAARKTHKQRVEKPRVPAHIALFWLVRVLARACARSSKIVRVRAWAPQRDIVVFVSLAVFALVVALCDSLKGIAVFVVRVHERAAMQKLRGCSRAAFLCRCMVCFLVLDLLCRARSCHTLQTAENQRSLVLQLGGSCIYDLVERSNDAIRLRRVRDEL